MQVVVVEVRKLAKHLDDDIRNAIIHIKLLLQLLVSIAARDRESKTKQSRRRRYVDSLFDERQNGTAMQM
jgi:hypothetical protein